MLTDTPFLQRVVYSMPNQVWAKKDQIQEMIYFNTKSLLFKLDVTDTITYSLDNRYKDNPSVTSIITDFNDYLFFKKFNAIYIPQIPINSYEEIYDTVIINRCRNPRIVRMMENLHPTATWVDYYDFKCNTLVCFSDGNHDDYAIDLIFNSKFKEAETVIYYNIFPFMTEKQSILDMIDVFDGDSPVEQKILYKNLEISKYTIDLTSWSNTKWNLYCDWVDGKKANNSYSYIYNLIRNPNQYVHYNTVEKFFDEVIF